MANGTKKNNVTTDEKKVVSIFMGITPAIIRMHEMNNNKPFLSVVDLVHYFKSYMAKYPQNIVKAFK